MTDLEISTEPIEPRQVKLTIVVPDGRIEQAMTGLAQVYARRLKIRGYRPGHVPLRLVLAHVPAEELREEAIESITRKIAAEAIRAEGLVPVGAVSVTKSADAPLTLEALVPLEPEIDLGDYHALRVPRPEPEAVTDEEVDAVLEQWRKDLSFRAPAERPSEAGDFLGVDLVGRLDDEEVFAAQELELPLTSEGATAAGLPTAIVDKLTGMVPGDDRTFDLVYPEFWSSGELQGQAVAFEAHASSVATMKLPELDDSLAREIGEIGTLAELRERVETQISARKALAERDRYIEAAMDALVAQSRVVYAPALLETEVAGVIAELKSRVERQGFTWERWLELQQKDEDALWDEIEPQTRQRLERALVLGAFARSENITVDREQVEAEIQRIGDEVFGETGRRPEPSSAVLETAASRMRIGQTLERLMAIASGGATEGAAEAASGSASEATAEAEPAAPDRDERGSA